MKKEYETMLNALIKDIAIPRITTERAAQAMNAFIKTISFGDDHVRFTMSEICSYTHPKVYDFHEIIALEQMFQELGCKTERRNGGLNVYK